MTGTSRRTFLKSSALTLPLAAAAPWSAAVAATPDSAKKATGAPRTYFDKGKRLSIAMWDFSWLMAHYPGGPYEDLDRRVAEAAERGYNTLRVDCFPSRLLQPQSTFPKKPWVPGVNLPMWGEVAQEYTCNVRKEVARLADACRKHGVWLGLDSWDKANMFRSVPGLVAKFTGSHSDIDGSGPTSTTIAEADEERAFTGYGELWVKALKLMREDGVLERAAWIAPMNEVPHFGSRSLESVTALRKGARNEGETKLEKELQEDAIYKRVNNWMAAPIHAEVARERIPISYSSLGAERYANRLTDLYDVVDVHFMPGVPTDKEEDVVFTRAARGATGPIRFGEFEKFDLKLFSTEWDIACRKHYPEMLNRVKGYFTTALENMRLPSGKQLTAVITECFGPLVWPDHPDVDWKWYKNYNADALRIVAGMDFAGSSLSNFGEPLFTLWDDVDWHWRSNTYFQALAQKQA